MDHLKIMLRGFLLLATILLTIYGLKSAPVWVMNTIGAIVAVIAIAGMSYLFGLLFEIPKMEDDDITKMLKKVDEDK